MKTFRRIALLLLISLIIASGLFFVNHKIIATSFGDKIIEILITTIPVFIIVSLLYFINRAVVRSVKSIKTKKPSK